MLIAFLLAVILALLVCIRGQSLRMRELEKKNYYLSLSASDMMGIIRWQSERLERLEQSLESEDWKKGPPSIGQD